MSLGDDGRALWLEWSARASKFDPREANDKWAGFTGDRTDHRAVFAEAQRRGWTNPARPYWEDVEILPSVRALTERMAAHFTAQARSPAAQSGDRYRLLSATDLAALPPVEWRVRNIFPAQGVGAIYGPSGSGKTFLPFDMAAKIAEGGHWFGHKVRPAAVVYCGLEGESGFKARAAAFEIASKAPLPNRLRFILQSLKITDRVDVDHLAASAIALGQSPVIVIDTLNRAAPEVDENSSKDMGAILEGAKRLQVLTSGLVILVHHTGKDATKGLRGHSSLFAAMDGAIEVRRLDDRRSWEVAKSKDGQDGAAHQFRLEVVHVGEDDGEPITSCVIHSEGGPPLPSRNRQPTGANQRLTLTALAPLFDASPEGDLVTGGAGVALEDAIKATALALTCPADRRNERAREAIAGLLGRGQLRQRDGRLWRA